MRSYQISFCNKDFAIIIQDSIPAREVEKIIENQHSEIVESYTLDVTKGNRSLRGIKAQPILSFIGRRMVL